MKTVKNYISLFVLALILISCDQFENKFYSKIEQAQKESIENNSPVKLKLEDITDFEWVKIMHVTGNESVPVFSFEIEPSLGRKTTDLDTYKNRFYFLNSKNELIVKDIDYMHSPTYEIESCIKDSTNQYYQWLTKEECEFILIPNTKVAGTGTVFLFPKCTTEFNRKDFGIFHKKNTTVN